MSGIVGTVHFDGSRSDPYLLVRMLAQISHRGPDASGIYTERNVGLGHTRLSVTDLRGGQQPMHNEDRSVWVIFDGEIFNATELRESLAGKGHRFTTRSDTEVIVHAYQQHGDDCVRHFNGQWALALWDRKRRRLLMSRDRLAERPVFYTEAGGKLLFASEIKSLFAHPDVDRRIDPVGLNQRLTSRATPAPGTVFCGIRELPPGHNLTVHKGNIQVRPFWQPDDEPPGKPVAEAECAGRLLDLLTDAARLRSRSDVPVGALLDGGLKSTVTAALANRFTDGPLRTFSIHLDDTRRDSCCHLHEAAEALGAEHQAFHCRREDVARAFPDVIWHAESPVLWTDPALSFLLFKAVREAGYKVLLTGESIDTISSGFGPVPGAKVGRSPASQPEATSICKTFFSEEFRRTLAENEAHDDRREPPPKALRSPQVDRMAMAHSVQQRSPFLDHRLAEFAARGARWATMEDNRRADLVERVMGDLVSKTILAHRRQPGRTPGPACFLDGRSRPIRHDYVEQLLSRRRIDEDGIFDPNAVACLVRKVREGRAAGADGAMALMSILSTGLVVDQFVRNFDARSAGTVACPTGPEPAAAGQVGYLPMLLR